MAASAGSMSVSRPSGVLPWTLAVVLHLALAAMALLAVRPSPPASPAFIAVDLLAPPLPAPPSAASPLPQRSRSAIARSPGVASPDGVARPETGAAPDGAAFIAPPETPSAAPQSGLSGLAGRADCDDALERLKPRCKGRWSERIPYDPAASQPSLEAMREQAPGFVSPFQPPAPLRREGAIGQAMARNSPDRGGAARLGGANEMVGRLPPPGAYHVDPGFGD